MRIRLLNVRIAISKNEVITDSIGNHRNVWTDYYSCHAAASSEVGKEMTAAGVVVDDSSIDFTIRCCEKVKAMNTTEYRVQFAGELYDIEGIDHMNFKNQSVKLKCRKVRR